MKPLNDQPASSESFLPLTPAVFHILLSLVDQERHGYGIMQEVERQSDGTVRLGPGTLYGSIKRMLAANLIRESDERPGPDDDDRRRRYYCLTDLGERVARGEAKRLATLVATAHSKRLIPRPLRPDIARGHAP